MAIQLDDTLADFLSTEGIPSDGVVFFAPSPVSNEDMSSTLERNNKYIITGWDCVPQSDGQWFQNMVLTPQRMAWMMGGMRVLMLSPDDYRPESHADLQAEVDETISAINPAQRFQLRVCDSWDEVASACLGLKVIPHLPSDRLAEFADHFTPPDQHYSLLTKRTLVTSSIPTPRTDIIDLDTQNPERYITEVVSTIMTRAMPYVFKTSYGASSSGTFIIRTAEERQRLAEVAERNLKIDVSQCTSINAHLLPCSVLFSQYLPGNCPDVNFYVGKNGNATFSSSTMQQFDQLGYWSGSIVEYLEQDKLEMKYKSLISTVAEFLHSKGYCGPVAIDVMTDHDGRHCVVDLNPRPSGSFILGCLRSHFHKQKRLAVAGIVATVAFDGGRSSFQDAFRKELTDGTILPVAWCFDSKLHRTYTSLVVGATSIAAFLELRSRIFDFSRQHL